VNLSLAPRVADQPTEHSKRLFFPFHFLSWMHEAGFLTDLFFYEVG